MKSIFLTKISHLGPAHLPKALLSLGESLWQTVPSYLPILTDDQLTIKFKCLP